MQGRDSEHKVFVEDDDGTGADSQANILSSAAPGLVHILAAPATSAGIGVVLTPSGVVLTSAQGLQGARRLTVRVVLSGRSYPARLVGTDRSYGLSLLQIAGGPAFRPVAIGINVAGTGSGLRHTGFAVPIDTALAVAKRIQDAHSR
jgi:S1-C subfamily serine protease